MYIGIIAEWNPFHTGHAHLLSVLHLRYPNVPIICAMSGSFVQRGEPAIFDKWTRASWAVQNGASAVMELPVTCVLQSADKFAAAGVHMLHALGCTHVAFGAETLTPEEIKALAAYTFSSAFSSLFHGYLQQGLPYAVSVNRSLEEKFPSLTDDVSKPNNLLAIQYARAIMENNLPMNIIAVPRNQTECISASGIRRDITANLRPIPIQDNERDVMNALIANGLYTDYQRYNDACLLFFRLIDKENLAQSALFSEGLENKWAKEMHHSSYEDVLNSVKSKRYLYSRLRRITASLLLSPFGGPSPMAKAPQLLYARLLALRREHSYILKRSTLPIVTSFARARQELSADAQKLLSLDRKATDLQRYCYHNPAERAGGQDYYRSPVIS